MYLVIAEKPSVKLDLSNCFCYNKYILFMR